jgi:hypothetical protein
MSMVRLMTYANQFDIEGLVATRNADGVFPELIGHVVGAYAKVRDNLEQHERGFPAATSLQPLIARGSDLDGMAGVGAGKDTPGSELLIHAVDRHDARPLWVTVWGGPNALAQALWKVRQTRSKADLDRFVAKLRVYAISDQDDSGPWIRREFPKLFYIVSPGATFHKSTWIGISGDTFHGRFAGGDYALVTNEWVHRNIRGKGPLSDEYPDWKYQMEGDTPSFLYLLNNGLNAPDHPDWGGWGGRYELYTPRCANGSSPPKPARSGPMPAMRCWAMTASGMMTNMPRSGAGARPSRMISPRMDWTIKPYAQANHPPVPHLGMPDRITAHIGQRVDLSAEGSSDPDGDALSYDWFVYEEPGTRSMSFNSSGVKLPVQNSDQPKAWLTVKADRTVPPGTGTIHVILAVTDHGTPRLTRYKRVIIDVVP